MTKETMNKLQEVLEKLRSDKELMALENDGTEEQLEAASEIVWPNADYKPAGLHQFYITVEDVWDGSDTNPCKESITVTEFLKLWESQNERDMKLVEALENVKPKSDGLLVRLEKKDKELREHYDLQHPLRQGFFLAECIVKKWAEENYPLGAQKDEGKGEEDKSTYIIYHNDKVNSILSAALQFLNTDQLIVLRDCLIERTPKQ